MLVSYTHRVQFKSAKMKRNISDFLFLFKRFALQTVYAIFKRFPVQIVQNMIKNIWNHFSYFERFASQNVHYIMNRTIYTPKMFITSWTEQNRAKQCIVCRMCFTVIQHSFSSLWNKNRNSEYSLGIALVLKAQSKSLYSQSFLCHFHLPHTLSE